MTNEESLQMQLQYGEKKYGENEPLVLELKRQIAEMQSEPKSRQQIEELRQQKPDAQSKTHDAGESGLMNYHAGFRIVILHDM